MLRFVDDQHRPLLGFEAQAGHFAADGAVEGGPAPLRLQSQLPGDALVEVHRVAGGERDIEDPVRAGVQRSSDLPTQSGLPAADIGRDQTDAAQVQQVPEADLQFAVRGRKEEILGEQVAAEGVAGEAEVLAVHQRSSSPSRRSARRRPAAGASGARDGVSVLQGRSRLTKQLA